MNSNWLKNYGASEAVRYLSNTSGDIFDRYAKVKSLWKNNSAYDDIMRGAVLSGVKVEAIKPYRTPVHRSVEWFASKLLAGATIQVSEGKEPLKDVVNQILAWSNFEGKKRGWTRNYALYGDSFLKFVFDGKKVYFEEIKAKHVTDFGMDSRNYLEWIRIDIPIMDESGKNKTYTEYWDENGYRVWEHSGDRMTELDKLGTPIDSGSLADFGLDFVPIVLAQFVDFDGERGMGCVRHALDKIDEANRMVTRLHQLLFRYGKPIVALLSPPNDKEGRPLNVPPIRVGDNNGDEEDYADIDMTIARLAGFTDVKSLVDGLDFATALKILEAQEFELEKDLPEIKSYALRGDDLAGAGKAMRLELSNAITRGNDARENQFQQMTRMLKICISAGIHLGVLDQSLGTFDNGDFDSIKFVADEILGMDTTEKSQVIQMLTASQMPLSMAMEIAGYDAKFIARVEAKKQEDDAKREANLANAMNSFNRE